MTCPHRDIFAAYAVILREDAQTRRVWAADETKTDVARQLWTTDANDLVRRAESIEKMIVDADRIGGCDA